MSFHSAIAVLKDRIFRYKMALHTLEELDTEATTLLAPATDPPAFVLGELCADPIQHPPAEKPGKKTKEQKKSSRSASAAEKRRQILEYISKHPACSAKEIVKNTGITLATVSWHLGHAKQEKQVEMLGKGAHSRWRIVQKSGSPSAKAAPSNLRSEIFDDESDPDERGIANPVAESKKPFGCDLCSARFLVKGSLLSHMRIVHQATAI